MKRRAFITLLGGAAGWPLAARAQQAVMPLVGFLSTRGAADSENPVAAFHGGMKEVGLVEGENVNRLQELVSDMVRAPTESTG
jgi:putative ABC transport system substrate-binding protein